MVAFEMEYIWSPGFTELQQGGVSLTYLVKTWEKEKRDWCFVEFLPAYVFVCLTEAS